MLESWFQVIVLLECRKIFTKRGLVEECSIIGNTFWKVLSELWPFLALTFWIQIRWAVFHSCNSAINYCLPIQNKKNKGTWNKSFENGYKNKWSFLNCMCENTVWISLGVEIYPNFLPTTTSELVKYSINSFLCLGHNYSRLFCHTRHPSFFWGSKIQFLCHSLLFQGFV